MGLIVAAAPAAALSIQEFNAFSDNARFGSLRLALSTEAYRNIRDGNIEAANCIARNFVGTTTNEAFGFNYLHENIAKGKETENVESYILGSIQAVCPSGGGKQGSAPMAVEGFNPSPVSGFFAKLVNDEERIDALRLALSTQALREENADNKQRAQCIMDKIVGKSELPKGFAELARQLGQARNSGTANVESYIIGAKLAYCGEEKSTKDKHESSGKD